VSNSHLGPNTLSGGAQAPAPDSSVLRTVALSRHWGALKAVDEFSFSLAEGARHALIGPNGAGKTTLINLLTGYLGPSSGDIYLGDERITQLPQAHRVKRGITRTFQISNLFPGLSVIEAVVMAILERDGLGSALGKPVSRYTPQIEEALALLEQYRLAAQCNELIRHLAYGKQRVLEIVLALATRPRILLLDEPAAGIPVGESKEIFSSIAALPRSVTVLFIEHDMNLVFRFAQRITVMASGRFLAEGTPAEIAADRRVREVYLGEEQHG
jgi:branched-chain amino acid transport system ATP-binding protein